MKIFQAILSFQLLINFFMPFTNQRLLYIFGKEVNPQLVNQQIKLLETTAAAVKERDIDIKVIAENDQLIKQFKVDPAKFTVVLVGKDGMKNTVPKSCCGRQNCSP